MKHKFAIDNQHIDVLFPFHFWLDRNLSIVKSGKGIVKLFPSLLNSSFSELFVFRRPVLGIEYTFDSISEYSSQIFILQATSGTPLMIRGQFTQINDLLFFTGSPWVLEVNDLQKYNLMLTDFALHDPVTDMLQILKVRELDLKDIENQRDQLSKKNREISDLAKFPEENPNPIIRIGLTGKIQYANKATEYMFSHWNCQVGDVYPDALKADIRHVIERDRKVENEIMVGAKYYSFQLVPFLENGYINFYANDITEKKLADDTIITTTQRLSTLISSLHEAILLENEKREIVLVNKSFCELFEIPVKPEDLVGMNCSSSAEDSKHLFVDPKGFVDQITVILKSQTPVFNEEIQLVNGKYVERDYIPISIDNEYRGHLWRYVDVTEKRNHIDQIKKSESTIKTILDSLPDLMFQLNHDMVFVDYRASSNTDLSLSPQDFMNKKLTDVFPTEFSSQLLEQMNWAKQHEKIGILEYELPDAQNEIQSYEARISWNKEVGYIFSIRNITLTKNAEKALLEAKDLAEQSVRIKEQFLANMSHEIRTPMNGILGMSKLLSEIELPEKQRGYLNAIRTSAKSLLVIINDILDLSKIESGKLQLETIGFSLTKLAQEVVHTVEYLAAEKDLYIKHTIDPMLQSQVVLGDPVRVNQILMNLLSNAIKFTEQGEISLSIKCVETSDDQIKTRFSVSDNGIGIPEEKLHTIFESFKQADSSTTRKFGGTGLGLAICKQLVELHEGNIWVESSVGKGSTFSFEITFPVGTESDLSVNEDSKILYDVEGVKVLLVEDHNINQVYAMSILEDKGMEAHLAQNGSEAIDALKRDEFDIVLMDIQMPEMGGLEATSIIRKDLKLNTPIIAITANALKGDSEKYASVGMNEYLSKPFNETELINKIGKLLNRPFLKESKQNQIEDLSEYRIVRAASTSLFSLSKLENMAHGEEGFVDKMIRLFQEEIPKSLKLMNEHLDKEEYDRVGAVAHQIKPIVNIMDIKTIEEVIQQIESNGRARVNTEQIAPLVKKVNETCSQVIEQLKQLNGDVVPNQ